MQHSFIQKFFVTVGMGFAAACLLWVYQHVVAQAIYENSNEGYRDMFEKKEQPRRF